MTIPLWVAEAAGTFWAVAGEAEPFPRELWRPIAYALPVTLVIAPGLRLSGIDAWLRRQEIICGLPAPDRALRACLVARRGQGLIFLDGADPPDERRFTLAHELAHFLRDYWLPRRRVAARVGPATLEVLDGDRPPRPEERIDAVVARIEIAYHVHLLGRTPEGAIASATVALAERSADLLAYELLAPAASVLGDRPGAASRARRAAVAARLAGEFGLPPAQAARYAALLVPLPAQGDGLLRRLGFVP